MSGPASSIPPQVPGYALLRCIGRGSYGEVWLARDGSGEYRAVKLVYRKTFEHDRPFERELSGIRKFEPISRSHPSQVSILHVGRNEQEGCFYYVMELADDANCEQPKGGKAAAEAFPVSPSVSPDSYAPRTLKSELTRHGRLPFPECLDIGIALATALDHLHQHGLIHRDIKPSNVIFVRGVPKLADIGLVTDVGATISYVGTEGFLPPEGPGTPQADLYSLGKVLYEISTGRDRMDFPELPTFVDEANRKDHLLELNAVFLEACQNDPRRRYQSAREMFADLTLLQSGKSLRRARALEQRLVTARRLTITAVVVLIAAALGNYFVQQRRVHEAQQEKAGQEREARRAQSMTVETRRRLSDLYVANGTALEAEGDYFGALVWFAKALRDEQDDPSRAASRRQRVESLWQRCPPLPALFAHSNGANCATFNGDGHRLITAGEDGLAQVWDANTGEPVGAPWKHRSRVLHAELSADGERALTVSADGTGQLWSYLASGAVATKLECPGLLQLAKFSPNGRQFVTAADDQDVVLWETSGQRPRFTFKHGEPIVEAVFSPDGRFIATASSDKTVRVWNTETGEAATFVLRNDDHIVCLAFSPESRRLASASGSQVRVWAARSGESAPFTLRHDATIQSVSFSPDGKRMLTASEDQTARVWDAVTGQAIGLPLRHKEAVRTAVFSPDGRFIATAGEMRVQLWNARTFNAIPPVLAHNATVHDVRFSPTGDRLLTASADGTARMMTVEAGTTQKSRSGTFDDETWMAWAQLLSGREISSGEQIAPMAAGTLRTLWQTLKSRFPHQFDPPNLLSWHQQAAETSERATDWFSARFHWEQAVAMSPGGEQFRAGRERAERELARPEAATSRNEELRIPARSTSARAGLIDLSRHYNAGLTETWLPTGGATIGNDLSALPPGLQKFGGVEFDVRGVIQLSGGAAENSGAKFPRRVEPIAVRRSCRKIHFLHGAAWSALAGTHIGSYVVRYANGESREIKIVFGQNVREWLAAPAPQLMTGAAVAWEGSNATSRALGLGVRLYQMTWANPLPGAEVREIDFKSTMENPAPFLLAVTVE